MPCSIPDVIALLCTRCRRCVVMNSHVNVSVKFRVHIFSDQTCLAGSPTFCSIASRFFCWCFVYASLCSTSANTLEQISVSWTRIYRDFCPGRWWKLALGKVTVCSQEFFPKRRRTLWISWRWSWQRASNFRWGSAERWVWGLGFTFIILLSKFVEIGEC